MAEALIAPHCLLCTSTTGCPSQNRKTLQPLVSSSVEPGMLEQNEINVVYFGTQGCRLLLLLLLRN